MMGYLISRAVALACLALGAAWPVVAEPTTPSPGAVRVDIAPDLVLIDARPQDEKVTHGLSSSLGSCEVGVSVFGDNAYAMIRPIIVPPDRIERLKLVLVQALGPRMLNNKKVTVAHYGVYLNNAAGAEGAAIGGALAGPVGALAGGRNAKTRHAKCEHEKMQFGWFDASELTTANPPLVVQIEVTIDGRSHAIRAVYSTQKDEPLIRAYPGALAKGEAAIVAVLAASPP